MEHITTTEDVKSDLIVTKGTTTAKKKTKKTKDNNQNIDKNSSNSSLEIGDIIEDLNGTSIKHTNNGLTNGVSSDHDTSANHQDNVANKESNKIVNNCQRLGSEVDALVERISDVDLNKSDKIEKCVKNSQDCLSLNNVTRCPECDDDSCLSPDAISFESYKSELQMGEIMRLIQKDLSEPYSIYTYRYFIHNWPKLCFLAMHNKRCIGAIVCKLDLHRKVKRGYIAMLAVDEKYRKRKIGSHLVRQAITAMVADDADEVVLETEITNKPALRLYSNLGFVRDKRLFRYYLNGVDALRLKLWLR